MHVYLVGFMGAGKSSCGRRLAGLLERPFTDLDEEIEALAGLDIPGIFRERGEEVFRGLESKALAVVAAKSPRVVATGGGVVTMEENLARMHRTGAGIWLDVPFAVLMDRLAGDTATERPLFADPASARALYDRRLELYRRAGMRLRLDGVEGPEEVAARALELLKEHGCAT